MCLDQVPPAGVPRRKLEEAVRRTTHWAERQRDAPRADGQLRFGITQGGVDPELRRRSTEEIAELDFDGNAIGGLAIGEDRDAMFETTDWAAAAPAGRQAALLHGHRRPRGHPRGDRSGRRHVRLRPADAHRPHRQRLTNEGRLNLRNARFARDEAPLDETCDCPACCTLHARLHPPPRQPERAARPAPALAPQSTLPDRADPGARDAIECGGFASYKRDRLERLQWADS